MKAKKSNKCGRRPTMRNHGSGRREIKASLSTVSGLIYGEGPDCPVPDEVWYQAMELE